MNQREIEQREKAIERSSGVCAVCGKPLLSPDSQMQYAHKIANTKMNRDKYGSFFIDHTLNGELVCSLACNQSVNIGMKQDEVLKLLADIVMYEIKNRY